MKFCQAMIGLPTDMYVPLARELEGSGFATIAMSDHVVHPETIESRYPYTPDGRPQYEPEWDFPDPWLAAAAMATVTERIGFVTNIFVLPARNPLLAAKTLATVSRLSGGRVSLGIGAGWMREEFEALGQRFEGRGRRMDEQLEILDAMWRGEHAEHHGEFYDLPSMRMLPTPGHPIPVLVGGDSAVALDRAARHDGWIGMYHTVEDLRAKCGELRRRREAAGVADRPFEIIASPLALPTPETLAELESMGVTTLLTSAWIAQGVAAPSSLEEAVHHVRTYADRWITAEHRAG
ncbi:MAG: TIGR03619 family F420-dependent LLM class oxidoreductase [Microthrixaceae bacterium]